MIVKSEKPLTEEEKNRLQGKKFIEAQGCPVVTDENPRVWHWGGPNPFQRASGRRDSQADKHGESVLEADK